LAQHRHQLGLEHPQVLAAVEVRTHGHQRGSFSRTPRPLPWLGWPLPISSIPAASSAATILVSVETTPRTCSSLLASIRWMVGRDTPDIAASVRWSMPSRARAARSWVAEIMPLLQHAEPAYAISMHAR